MTGRRLPDNTKTFREGDYCKFIGREGKVTWMCRPPDCHLGNLGNHEVTEHEDGTITVSPSILIDAHERHDGSCPGWHGFLERGVWRSA